MRHVTEHLKTSYSDCRTPDEVEAAISTAYASFDTTPIRTYVPVLTERKARRILREHAIWSVSRPRRKTTLRRTGPPRQRADGARDRRLRRSPPEDRRHGAPAGHTSARRSPPKTSASARWINTLAGREPRATCTATHPTACSITRRTSWPPTDSATKTPPTLPTAPNSTDIAFHARGEPAAHAHLRSAPVPCIPAKNPTSRRPRARRSPPA
ncbi:three-helix bundle dimerization domain-containing protein [Streptomyces sp. NPDC050988]|uniref:three-helix bundle dimerization domain-containing protein n=1 Tax=Streptomyces sp. NPDC050988 TaxID=3365637 RepID=UPI0037BBA75B